MNFGEHVAELYKLVDVAKKKWSSVGSWGAFGLCWGGKVSCSTVYFDNVYAGLCVRAGMLTMFHQITALASGADTPFAVSGQVHPGSVFHIRCSHI